MVTALGSSVKWPLAPASALDQCLALSLVLYLSPPAFVRWFACACVHGVHHLEPLPLSRPHLSMAPLDDTTHHLNLSHRQFSYEDVAAHSATDDAWVAVDGEVYDVTTFLQNHPGGAQVSTNSLSLSPILVLFFFSFFYIPYSCGGRF